MDLVIWNEDHSGYRQLLQERIMGLIAAGTEATPWTGPAVSSSAAREQMSDEDRILMQTVARAILTDAPGRWPNRSSGAGACGRAIPALHADPPAPHRARHSAERPRRDLIFFKDWEGSRQDGREYVITTAPGQITPAPWVNVLANPYFGTVVSESGCGLHLE